MKDKDSQSEREREGEQANISSECCCCCLGRWRFLGPAMYGYTYVCIIAHTYIYTLKAHAFLLFFGAPRLFRFFKKSANKYPSCVHAYILYIAIYAYICVGTYERTLFSYIRQNNTRQHGISNIWKRVLCLCLFLFLFNLRACVCVCVRVSCICEWLLLLNRYRNKICSCPTKLKRVSQKQTK